MARIWHACQPGGAHLHYGDCQGVDLCRLAQRDLLGHGGHVFAKSLYSDVDVAPGNEISASSGQSETSEKQKSEQAQVAFKSFSESFFHAPHAGLELHATDVISVNIMCVWCENNCCRRSFWAPDGWHAYGMRAKRQQQNGITVKFPEWEGRMAALGIRVAIQDILSVCTKILVRAAPVLSRCLPRSTRNQVAGWS